MTNQVFPTKGNLMALTKSYALAKKGYELMDRKRNILIREMMTLIEDVRVLRHDLSKTYKQAYQALQEANITLGIVSDIAKSIPLDNNVEVTYRSVMGVEIPKVSHFAEQIKISYGIGHTNTKFDYAYKTFQKVRELTVKLAEIDNSTYRLANAIRKTQKRANALKNIVIPRFEEQIKYITDALEEKEREAFTRQKVIKSQSEKRKNQLS
ncbi:MAG TPA: V-type ATP synthase subunit D [Acholeplasmataceae bacterium]|jgi:V/A-type H+-transporting ATPase subunit D|nr:V-type ATP synthase subunit D [Acholeplasmataceae bacterium]HRX45181.1 V-type ATP synthase subunit D [Acholeplasmataceae bacterium]